MTLTHGSPCALVFEQTLVMFLENEYPQLSPEDEVRKLHGEQHYEQKAAASAHEEMEER